MADDIFDPVPEAKNRLDLSGFSDAQIYNNLSDPAKFRSTFPEYKSMDDGMTLRNMQKVGAQNPSYVASAVPAPIQQAIKSVPRPSSVQMDTSALGSAYS